MKNDNSGGIEFLDALTIVFITLKLTGVIDWSWLWVLCPMLIPVVLTVLLTLIEVKFREKEEKK